MNNYISKLFNPTCLFLLWRSPIEEEAFFAVAKIEKTNKNIVFSYLNGTEDYKKALERGFNGYPAFSLEEHSYDDGILDVFMRRLPPRKREDFQFYLNQIGLEQNIVIEDFTLLAYSGAQLATDNFRLVFSFENLKAPCEFLMEVVGVRHYLKDTSDIKLNDSVDFVPEPTNQYDSNAIKVMHKNRIIGYISKLQAHTFIKVMTEYDIKATIQKLNGTKLRPRIFIKVSV